MIGLHTVRLDHVVKHHFRAEGIRQSVTNCLSKLRGAKRIDLYQCSRVDKEVPVEETIKAIAGFVAEEKIDFIGMSECRAETLRRGHAVSYLLGLETWIYHLLILYLARSTPSLLSRLKLVHGAMTRMSEMVNTHSVAYANISSNIIQSSKFRRN